MCDYSLHTIASRPTTADMLVRNLKMGTEVLYIEIVIECSIPVSYTHLDVYKRQLWVRPPCRLIQLRIGPG